MGQKYQRSNGGAMEISLQIRDENMRRIFDVKDKSLLEGVGDLLSYCMNKLNISFTDLVRAELRSESKNFENLKTEHITKALKELEKSHKW